MRDRIHLVFAALALTGLGLVSGFYAARSDGGAAADHAPEPAAVEADADHHEVHLTPAARANLGVAVAPLELTTFAAPTRIPAMVEAAPLAERTVHAVVGGRVAALGPAPGESAAPGATLVELLREPIPPPPILVCREALMPDHGEIHAAIRALREELVAFRIANDELERIREFSGADAPVVPRERIVALEYDRRRARTRAESAAHELERHGFSLTQIEELARGDDFPSLFGEPGTEPEQHDHGVAVFTAGVVRRALEHSGIWSGSAAALRDALPEPLRDGPLAIAAIGELVALRRAPAELATWLQSDPVAAERFLDVASLLLQGVTLTDVRALVALEALGERVAIRAPDGNGGHRVTAYHVRPGATVATGDPLVALHDASAVRLRITPVGGEIATVLDAIARRLPCRAEPLLAATGPTLADVVLTHAVGAMDDAPAAAYADLVNSPVDAGADGPTRHRTWRLRPGTRYELMVPTHVLDDVFVVPRAAVIEDAGERSLLVEHADDGGFEAIPIAVAWEDHRRVVLRRADQDPRLAPGTPIVYRGAFEIGLLMHAGDHAMTHDHH